MRDPLDRFLSRRRMPPSQSPLGRVYGVTRQSWPLDADPRRDPPERLVLASGRSAAEAADIARAEATALQRHGFHKPSGAWWSVEDGQFHRYVVAPKAGRKTLIALGAGVIGIGLFALSRTKKNKRSAT